MAMGARAIHFYGVHLGQPDDAGWQVAEADEFGIIPHRWARDDEDPDEGLRDWMRRVLLRSLGLDDGEIDALGDDARDRELAERGGVAVVWSGRTCRWPPPAPQIFSQVLALEADYAEKWPWPT